MKIDFNKSHCETIAKGEKKHNSGFGSWVII